MGRYAKWAGIALGGIFTALVMLIIVLAGVGGAKINRTLDVPVAAVVVPTDAVSIERGRHLVESVGFCQECHGDNFEGQILGDDPLFGRLAPANLTRGDGGIGGELQDIDYVRAIRHGINREGKAILIMPSEKFNVFGDEDLGVMIAYLKTVPPVDNQVPKSRARLLARILTVFDPSLFPANLIDYSEPRTPAPKRGVTAEYGKYLGTICSMCHGQNLGGQFLPDGSGGVFAPNITQGGTPISWSEEDFISTIRSGTTPGGNKLDPENMPWPRFAKLTDDELGAIWLYLKSLPPVTPGAR